MTPFHFSIARPQLQVDAIEEQANLIFCFSFPLKQFLDPNHSEFQDFATNFMAARNSSTYHYNPTMAAQANYNQTWVWRRRQQRINFVQNAKQLKQSLVQQEQ